MKCCCCDGEYDAAGQQIARLQAQLKDHRLCWLDIANCQATSTAKRHLYYQVGDMLDDCQVMLADGHDQVMSTMIEDLRDILGSGSVREDMGSGYQEQNDHPLTYLAYTLELSLPATTALACADRDTLEELAIKVARQQTRMKEAEVSAQGNRQQDDCPHARKPEGNRSSTVPDDVATEGFMDQAAEQTLRRQAADAASSSQAPRGDLSAPADHTINMCMQCEVEPGIDWPLGLLCRKCYLELSETGLQAYGHA